MMICTLMTQILYLRTWTASFDQGLDFAYDTLTSGFEVEQWNETSLTDRC